MQKRFGNAALFLALFTLFFSSRLMAEAPPAWSLPDLNGKKVSLADFKGKVVVLNFWATWCPPCLAEIPTFIEAQKKYRDKGFTVIGLSIDSLAPGEVAKFVKEHKMNYPIVMADEATAETYGADIGVPLTIVVNRGGDVVARHLGIVSRAELDRDLTKAFAR